MVAELRPGLATTLRPHMAARLVRERRGKRAMSKLVQVLCEVVGVGCFCVWRSLALHAELVDLTNGE